MLTASEGILLKNLVLKCWDPFSSYDGPFGSGEMKVVFQGSLTYTKTILKASLAYSDYLQEVYKEVKEVPPKPISSLLPPASVIKFNCDEAYKSS